MRWIGSDGCAQRPAASKASRTASRSEPLLREGFGTGTWRVTAVFRIKAGAQSSVRLAGGWNEESYGVSGFRDQKRREMVHITDEVEQIVRRSGVKDGLCFVSPMHITAAMYVNDLESGLIEDIGKWLEELAPARPDYKHHQTGEDNGDAHLKSLLLHHETTLPVTNGRLDLGTVAAGLLCRVRRAAAQAGDCEGAGGGVGFAEIDGRIRGLPGPQKRGTLGHPADRLKGRVSPCGKTHALSRTWKVRAQNQRLPSNDAGFSILSGLFLSPALNSSARFWK